jgi:RNA-directed DNA polymerase
MTAKLSRPRGSPVNPALVQDSRYAYLGRSRLTSERTTPCGSTAWRSEKSAEAIVAARTLPHDEGPNGKERESAVHLGTARRQMTNAQFELPLDAPGAARCRERCGEARPAGHGGEHSGGAAPEDLMGGVVERSNLVRALRRVRQNQGSPGIDGMTVDELPTYLHAHWPGIREALLAGTYQPQAVRRHQIPKAGGRVRQLGIPTVLDRFIQQALLQVLQPRFDPTSSAYSYGFRPGRRAHDAVGQAQRYIQAGHRWVVDVDLAEFFDRVHHDVLLGKLAHRITDRRVLRLIRRYLEAGVLLYGVVVERHEGTPQGGPVSPPLANVLLDEVDQELMRRGTASCATPMTAMCTCSRGAPGSG